MIEKQNNEQAETESCDECPVRSKSICSGCSTYEKEELERMQRYKNVAASEFIAHQGQSIDFVANLVSGVVYTAQTLVDGRRQIEGLLLPGDFIGYHNRVSNEFDFVAATPVRLCVFERSSFRRLMESSPKLSCQLLGKVQDERDAARRWMLLLGRKTARERIATLLLLLAQIDCRNDEMETARSITFNMPLSQTLIADYLGLTLETVNRQLSSLRRKNVISFPCRQQITILDIRELKKLS